MHKANWLDDFRQHAISEYPKEAVGIVDTDGKYHPKDNIADDPTKHYRLSGKVFFEHNIDRICHSHPITNQVHDPLWPSGADMDTFISLKQYKHTIIATDGINTTDIVTYDDKNIPPLLGRKYVHGITDCWSVIRDWHRLNGRDIKDFARDYNWWTSGKDLYMSNFDISGAKRIYPESINDLLPGDILIIRTGGQIYTHGIVVTDTGGIHHYQNRLSETMNMDQIRRHLPQAIVARFPK